MKVLFTLGVGVVLGWASAQCDTEGQLALEQHQLEVDSKTIYKASATEVEATGLFSNGLFIFP